MKARLLLCIGFGLLATSMAVAQQSDPQAAPAAAPRFFELRIYTTHPGKLDALSKRFREHTNRLFQKHGMELIGYWTPTDGPEADNTLIYVLAYPDRAAREKAWQGFLADDEWKMVYEESHRDGPILAKVESKFMTATDYSPIK